MIPSEVFSEENDAENYSENSSGMPQSKVKESKEKRNIKRYITLTSDGDPFLDLYNYHYKHKFGKNHPKISEEQLSEITSFMDYLRDMEVNQFQFSDACNEHFETMSSKNDGKIFAFLHASARYFELSFHDQWQQQSEFAHLDKLGWSNPQHDPEIASRNMEIAFNQWVRDGNDPAAFVWDRNSSWPF